MTDPLQPIEGMIELELYTEAWDAIEEAVLEDSSLGMSQEVMVLRLKIAMGIAATSQDGKGWNMVELLAELLAKQEHPHLTALASEAFHAIARYRCSVDDEKAALEAVGNATRADPARRLAMVEDSQLDLIFGGGGG